MQPYPHDYRGISPLSPYNPDAKNQLGQMIPQYDQDGRFWGFGLLPFVGGLLLGGVGGYAIGNNNNCAGKNCGGYPQGGYPYPYPQPYPQPYPYPVPAQGNNLMYEPTSIQYTSNENYYLQPARLS